MELINIKEAAKIAKVKPQTIYQMINRPDCGIQVYRLSKKIFRIEKEEFQNWIKNQGKKGGAE